MATATKTAKKTTTKKTTKKKSAKSTGEFGAQRSNDVKWTDKKVSLFKALKQLRAISATAAKSAEVIAKKAGISARDVRHYSYHAAAVGLTGMAKLEEVRGYAFYLTAKGAKVDPVKELKDQAAKSNGKK